MSTMVERVALAILRESEKEAFPNNLNLARAAIEAMLEPTAAMVLSQGKSRPENAATETQRERAEALNRSVRSLAVVTWREMIQAALKENA